MWDRAKKAELGYTHPKTRVWTDENGNVIREVLHGEDWIQRKRELWARSGGRCEYQKDIGGIVALRCCNEAHDPCHIEPRHPVRNDMLSNLMAGCRDCHRKHDKQSWRVIKSAKVEAA